MLGVVTILFVIFKTVPGDEATMVAGATATQAEIDVVRHQLGLDRPLLVQYGEHIVSLLHGDLGYSSTFRGNPLPRILERVPATLLLTAAAIALTVMIGIPAGIARRVVPAPLAGLRRFDRRGGAAGGAEFLARHDADRAALGAACTGCRASA